ncbi:MAG TPA: hypothetical protein DD420_04950 [Streptomyces sp.]|nr:hypothetical protein [Armatimonadota bacterium]HBF79291.1 hypothetical protein [Streptomyces sp.]
MNVETIPSRVIKQAMQILKGEVAAEQLPGRGQEDPINHALALGERMAGPALMDWERTLTRFQWDASDDEREPRPVDDLLAAVGGALDWSQRCDAARELSSQHHIAPCQIGKLLGGSSGVCPEATAVLAVTLWPDRRDDEVLSQIASAFGALDVLAKRLVMCRWRLPADEGWLTKAVVDETDPVVLFRAVREVVQAGLKVPAVAGLFAHSSPYVAAEAGAAAVLLERERDLCAAWAKSGVAELAGAAALIQNLGASTDVDDLARASRDERRRPVRLVAARRLAAVDRNSTEGLLVLRMLYDADSPLLRHAVCVGLRERGDLTGVWREALGELRDDDPVRAVREAAEAALGT